MDLRKVIAVDFDGTICTNAYPDIGNPIRITINFLKYLKSKDWAIVLWTCREGKLLEEAIHFCEELGIHFDAINESLKERVEYYGHDSRKLGADIYLDDKSINPSSLLDSYSTIMEALNIQD